MDGYGSWAYLVDEGKHNMKFFNINRSMKYIIYGAGGNCFRVKKLLQNAQYTVAAILDKRAGDIYNIEDVPVYTPENYALVDKEKDKSVIVISVKNVFEHINIARTFLELGYERIIYKPLPILQGEHDEEWDSINYVYETIVEKNISLDTNVRIACSRRDYLMIFKDELLIEDKGDQVLCWLPIELMCNYDSEDAYKLVPMAAFYPLLNMYQYLHNTGNECKWEIIENDFFLYSADWVERNRQDFSYSLKRSMINSRINVYNNMQNKADIDINFFIRNAVSVKRKDSIRFYLTASGRNRVSFLAARGNRFIPVYMSRKDYHLWLNQHKFEEFRQYLEKEKISKFFTILQHPMMITYASETTDYVHFFCMPVIKEIFRLLHWKTAEKANDYYKISLENYIEKKAKLKIFVAVKDEGCMGRMLLMHGMNCYRLYYSQKQERISELIDGLFNIKDSKKISYDNGMDVVRTCEIMILDSRINIPAITDFRGDTIFMLQWGRVEMIIDRLQETFVNKKLLFQTIWQQEKVSGWMLKKQ